MKPNQQNPIPAVIARAIPNAFAGHVCAQDQPCDVAHDARHAFGVSVVGVSVGVSVGVPVGARVGAGDLPAP